MPSVSIVTITQLSRHKCLKNLYNLIQLQDYTNSKEWVIVEGSKTLEDAESNKYYINELKDSLNSFDIIYIEYTGPTHLSDLRNLGIAFADGSQYEVPGNRSSFNSRLPSACIGRLPSSMITP